MNSLEWKKDNDGSTIVEYGREGIEPSWVCDCNTGQCVKTNFSYLFCIATFTVFTGCTNRSSSAGSLSIEEARSALIELVKVRADTVLSLSLESLKTNQANFNKDGNCIIGQWGINLKSKTFVYSVANPSVFYEISGEFERAADDSCVAVITREREN